eukprot:15430201-Alexandrium_andersonii.AAC.1
MVGATAMNEKSVVMKVEPGKVDQQPSHEGVQDVSMQDAHSDSDSEDEHRSERSEDLSMFENIIAQDKEQFSILGEAEVVRALASDAA